MGDQQRLTEDMVEGVIVRMERWIATAERLSLRDPKYGEFASRLQTNLEEYRVLTKEAVELDCDVKNGTLSEARAAVLYRDFIDRNLRAILHNSEARTIILDESIKYEDEKYGF